MAVSKFKKKLQPLCTYFGFNLDSTFIVSLEVNSSKSFQNVFDKCQEFKYDIFSEKNDYHQNFWGTVSP